VFQPAASIRDRPALTIRLTEQIISGIIKLYLDGAGKRMCPFLFRAFEREKEKSKE